MNPQKVLTDSLTGLTGYAAYRMMNLEVSLRKYIEQRAAAIQAKQRQISCGTAQKVKAADPVGELTPKVPEIAENITSNSETKTTADYAKYIYKENGNYFTNKEIINEIGKIESRNVDFFFIVKIHPVFPIFY